MSKARELSQRAGVDGALSNRNLIINGAMQVWQRGTSFTAIGYTADRWYQTWNGSGTTRSTTKVNPAQSLWDTVGSQAIRVANTGAPTGQTTNRLEQRIEAVTRVSNKDVTLSFWAKADASATYSVDIEQNFGSGGSATVAVGSQNVSLTTSWVEYTVTFTLPSIASATIGSSHYLAVIFNLPLNSTFGLEITGVQLEVGDTATPFEHRSYGQELALCQRYYESLSLVQWSALSFDSGNMRSQFFPYKVVKRVSPTLAAGTTGPYEAWNGAVVVNLTQNTFAVNETSGFTVGFSGSTGNLTCAVVFTTLSVTADAEL